MDGKDVIFGLRTTIEDAKKRGMKNMPISLIEQHISYAEKYACQCYDYQKMNNDKFLESFRSVISSGANAIKAAMLMNGGGAVALLAFFPRVNESGIEVNTGLLASALLWFTLGVFLAALGSGFAYFTQRAYHDSKAETVGNWLTALTSSLVFAGYSSFFVGVYWSAGALGLIT